MKKWKYHFAVLTFHNSSNFVICWALIYENKILFWKKYTNKVVWSPLRDSIAKETRLYSQNYKIQVCMTVCDMHTCLARIWSSSAGILTSHERKHRSLINGCHWVGSLNKRKYTGLLVHLFDNKWYIVHWNTYQFMSFKLLWVAHGCLRLQKNVEYFKNYVVWHHI